jgi:hypothetical protein
MFGLTKLSYDALLPLSQMTGEGISVSRPPLHVSFE